MAIKEVVPNVYQISLGVVNAFLIDAGNLTLIDTGIPGSGDKILQAVRELGKQSTDIKNILVTHCHADHTGSLAILKKETGAPATMHPLDAAMVRKGESMRPAKPPPQIIYQLIVPLLMRTQQKVRLEASEIEYEAEDGDILDIAGGIKVIHAPGHCAGQIAFLWPRHGGVLFAADAAGNTFNLGWSFIYEDFEEGKRSLGKLAALDFEVACFGHGKAIAGGAAEQFRRKWNPKNMSN